MHNGIPHCREVAWTEQIWRVLLVSRTTLTVHNVPGSQDIRLKESQKGYDICCMNVLMLPVDVYAPYPERNKPQEVGGRCFCLRLITTQFSYRLSWSSKTTMHGVTSILREGRLQKYQFDANSRGEPGCGLNP